MTKTFSVRFFTILFVSIAAWGLAAKAQRFELNTIHSSFSKDDIELLKKIARFEATFYNTVFNTTKNDSLLIRINLYGRRSEFDALQGMPNSTFFDGFYSPAQDRIFVMKTEKFMPITQHEASHDFLHNNYGNPPRWLNEGIAQIFENLVSQGNQIYYQPQKYRIKTVKDMIYTHTFNLGAFFKAPDSDWFKVKTQVEQMYAISYCVIYYFVKYDMESLSNILIMMKQGTNATDAITRVFGGFSNFEKRFLDFYKPGVDYVQ